MLWKRRHGLETAGPSVEVQPVILPDRNSGFRTCTGIATRGSSAHGHRHFPPLPRVRAAEPARKTVLPEFVLPQTSAGLPCWATCHSVPLARAESWARHSDDE